jgi:hemoglobin/transferrin/lactoferrin receptor protein
MVDPISRRLHCRASPLLLLAAALGSSAHAQETPRLGEILVTAQRDDSTVLSARELERRAATDMAGMVRYDPLISVPGALSGGANIWDGAGNTGFNIRGVEGNRVSLALDGIALPDAAPRPDGSSLNSFGVGRDYVDPETLREVRIGAGTSPAAAGTPGLAGAVAFVTKAPGDYLNAQRGSYAAYKFGYTGANASRLHALTAAAQLGSVQALAVLAHRSGGAAASKGSVPPNPDDWNSDAVLAKLSWLLAPGHQLGFTFDGYRAQHDRLFHNKLGAAYPDGASQASHTQRNRVSIDQALTRGAWLFENRLYLQDAQVAEHTNARYITGGQPTARSIDTGFYNKTKGLALNATRLAGADTLAFGVSVEEVDSRRPWREDRTVLASGAHQITNKNRMADTDTRQLAAYLRGEFALTSHWTLSPGLRGEYRSMEPRNQQAYVVAVPAAARELRKEHDSYLAPSVNLSLALAPQLSTYLQYSRGYRLPTAAERTGTYDSFSYTGAGNGYATLGNAELKKERSDAVELGLKGEVMRGLRFNAALFHTSYRDFIDYAAQPADPVNYPTITYGLFRPENIGKAASWGGEWSATADLGQLQPALQGYSATLAAGAARGSAQNTRSGARGELASMLPYKASTSLAWDDPAKRGGWSLSAFHTRAKQAAIDVSSATTPPAAYFAVPAATVLDLAGYWNLGQHLVFNAGIYNLGDRKYWDYAAARTLPAGTTAVAQADIERQARPGRTIAAHFKLIY